MTDPNESTQSPSPDASRPADAPSTAPPPLPPGNYPGAPTPAPQQAAPPPQQAAAPPPQAAAPRPAAPQWQGPTPMGPGAAPQPQPWGAPPPQGWAPPPQQGPWPPNPYANAPQPYRPAGPAPGGFAQPQRRANPFPAIAGAILLITLLVGGGLVLMSALGSSGGPAAGTAMPAGGGMFVFGDRIAILEVNGVLGEGPGYGADTASLINQVKAWEDNSSVKGIVVRINSPGGAVSATQELHQALENYKQRTNRPVVASMGDVAASGGYYAAMSADRVFANPGTLTGSIGVIMSSWQYDSLTEKIGVKERVIKSGEFKDIMSGAREMSEAERALMDTMVKDVYTQFLDHVTLNRREMVKRRLTEKNGVEPSGDDVATKIRSVADGRVFSGRQAFEDGMIDELGTLDDAVAHAAQLAGLKPSNQQIPTIAGPVRPRGLFGKMEARLEQATRALPGTVLLEYRLHM